MRIDGTYLCDKIRLEVVKCFLSHELKKLDFYSIKSKTQTIKSRTTMQHSSTFSTVVPELLRHVDNSEVVLSQISCEDLWKLFHAISYGLLEKCLFNCVGHPNFIWSSKRVKLDNLLLETPVGILQDAVTCEKSLSFKSALCHVRSKDKNTLKKSMQRYDRDSNIGRTQDPLIGRLCGNGKIKVHDGNGRIARICARIALDQIEAWQECYLDIWVGEEVPNDPINLDLYSEFRKDLFATHATK